MKESGEATPEQGTSEVPPEELLRRGLQSRVSTSGTPRWEPPSAEDLQRLLPQYEIGALIGRGGMGAVYRGKQHVLERAVAIKLLPGEMTEDNGFVARFQREARMLARLQHPGIVTVYDFGQTSQGHVFFVMEFVNGTDLSQVLRGPGVNPDQALEIVAQVCEALQYAHAQGVVHRDIKPANVLLTQDGRAKLVDFGLARPMSGETSKFTQSNIVMGTPDYMAPEQMYGIEDHRADLFSLGVMLYEMLTGRPPRGSWLAPSQRVQVDVRLDDVVIRALQEDPELRYQQASEIKTDVDLIRTTPPPPPAPPAAPLPARKKPLTHAGWVTGGLLLLAAAAGAFFFFNPTNPAPRKADDPPAAAVIPVSTATKDAPFVNSLGMKFVPVPGSKVLMCKHETRRSDYEAFAAVNPSVSAAWRQPLRDGKDLGSTGQHPVCNVTWDDARAFCEWLSRKENRVYRLPTDREWRLAVGLGDKESATAPPRGLSGKSPGLYPWGTEWPPPAGSGNFADASSARTFKNVVAIPGYDDGHPGLAPVMSFRPNALGIHDLAGNVWEWSQDWFDQEKGLRLVRGGCLSDGGLDKGLLLRSDARVSRPALSRHYSDGFRVVVETLDPHEGQTPIHGNATAAGMPPFRDVEKIDREGLPEEEAPKLVGMDGPLAKASGTASALAGTPGALSSGKGNPAATRTVAAPAGPGQEKQTPSTEGWVDLIEECRKKGNLPPNLVKTGNVWQPKGSLHIRSLASFKNGAVRLTCALREPKSRTVVNLRQRPQEQLDSYRVSWDSPGNSFRLVSGVPAEGQKIWEKQLNVPPYDPLQMNTLEFWAVGEELKIVFNGRVAYTLQDSRLQEGFAEIFLTAGMEVAKAEYRVLASDAASQASQTQPVIAAVANDGDERLKKLEEGFRSRYEMDARKPFDAGVVALNESYLSALGRARAKVQSEGLLDEVNALDKETERVKGGQAVPPSNAGDTPASLKLLRETYRQAFAKLEQDRDARGAPLYEIYLGALDAYVAELTRGNQIEQARKVKALRDGIAANKSTLINALPNPGNGPTKTAGTETGSSSPPAASPSLAGPSWRKTVLAVFELGGRVSVLDSRGRRVSAGREDELPAGRFDCWNIQLNGPQMPKKAGGITDEDFSQIVQAEKLQILNIGKHSLTARSLPLLGQLKELEALSLCSGTLTDADFAELPPLPKLRFLDVNMNAIQGQGLALFSRQPVLKSLIIGGNGFAGEGLGKGLSSLTKLESLSLWYVSPQASSAIQAIGRLPLRWLMIHGGGWDIRQLPDLPDLEGLVFNDNALITSAELPQLARFKKLRRLELAANQGLGSTGWEVLKELPALRELNLSRNRGVNDGCLIGLKSLKNLQKVTLRESNVSEARVAELRQALPECVIEK